MGALLMHTNVALLKIKEEKLLNQKSKHKDDKDDIYIDDYKI